MSDPTPLVTASRDALRSTLADHFIMWRELNEGPRGEWFCACGLKFGFSDSAIDHQADALAGVVRAVDGLAEDESLVERVARGAYPATGGRGNAAQVLRALAAALATPTDPSEA